jgi:hypothetical protein
MPTRESGLRQRNEIHAHQDRPLNLRESALLACAFLTLGLSFASFLTI